MKSYGERKVQKLQLYLSSNVCMFQYDMLFTRIIIKKELAASKYNTTEMCF